jgi:hypothetical protein
MARPRRPRSFAGFGASKILRACVWEKASVIHSRRFTAGRSTSRIGFCSTTPNLTKCAKRLEIAARRQRMVVALSPQCFFAATLQDRRGDRARAPRGSPASAPIPLFFVNVTSRSYGTKRAGSGVCVAFHPRCSGVAAAKGCLIEGELYYPDESPTSHYAFGNLYSSGRKSARRK